MVGRENKTEQWHDESHAKRVVQRNCSVPGMQSEVPGIEESGNGMGRINNAKQHLERYLEDRYYLQGERQGFHPLR